MLFPTSGPSSLPIVSFWAVVVATGRFDESHANRAASVLSGMTDAEHSTTSGSNKKGRN